ncbi:hypothetical protein WUBG_17269 [Wuchereria bancrofti]|uniref:Uncharacterized protein n=1 Tax=Wuchereria bancrofti TaxID=6293 RepID=J9E8X5_WUCBA|nr:hypothetical protein WUBG_17269 [Wuchereria bancrofti]
MDTTLSERVDIGVRISLFACKKLTLSKTYTKTKRRLKRKPSQSSENRKIRPRCFSVRHATSGSNASDPMMQSLRRLNAPL